MSEMESEENTESSLKTESRIRNETEAEDKKNNCHIEECNEIECITESYNKDQKRSEDDIELLIQNLLQFDTNLPTNSNDKIESNLSFTKAIETDVFKLSVLLESANQNDEIKYNNEVSHLQEENFELSHVMNDHNYISQELTAYSKNFNPQFKSIAEIKKSLVSYIVGAINKSDFWDYNEVNEELDQFLNSLFQNLDAFKFKTLSKFKSCTESDQQKTLLSEQKMNSPSDDSIDGKEIPAIEIKHQETLSEIKMLKYLMTIKDSLNENALVDNNEIEFVISKSPTSSRNDLDSNTESDEKTLAPLFLISGKGTEIINYVEDSDSGIKNNSVEHAITSESNFMSDLVNRAELNEISLQYSNIQFDSKTLAENCSEPLEYMGVDDLSEDFENESHMDELQLLQQFSAFGSQLLVDCQVFKSSKTSIKDKLPKYILSKYSEFKALVQTLNFLTESATQTDPIVTISNLRKRNENDKSILLQSTDSESDADIETSECNLQFRLPSDLECNTGEKEHKVNGGNLKLKEVLKFDEILHPAQEYDDCVSLSRYIQSEIFESEALSDNDSYAEFNDIDDIIAPIVPKMGEKIDPVSLAKELETLNESDKENGSYCSRVPHVTEKKTKCNTKQDEDHDKDIERLINLNGLEKRQMYSISSKQLDTESYKSKVISTANQKAGKNILCVISSNVTQKELPSDDSMSEQEEEIITEKQFLARYNQNLKQQLLNGSSSDSENVSDELNDDINGNFSDKNGRESPSVESFLKKFNADKSDDDDDRSDISNENLEKISSAENTDKSLLVRSNKSDNDNDDIKLDNGNHTFERDKDSSNNSDCEFLNHHFYKKRSRPKSLEILLSEAEKRKQHNKFEEDLISLSSDSDKSDLEALDTEHEPKRVIKPMLRQDQLAGETRKAQKLEADRIRRLEKKQVMLSKILPDRSELDLILDYNSQTKTFIKVHPGIVKLLKPHQVEGVRFMYDSCYGGVDAVKKSSGSGCILAHCMGLGKTLQLIALLHTVITYKELKTTKILVLCPKSTVMNWADEIQRWLGPINTKNLKLYTFNDTSDINEKLNTIKEWSFSTHNKAGCLLIGYEAFRTLVFFHSYKNRANSPTRLEEIRENVNKYLLKPGADLVVCDEGHIIKNRKSAISLAVAEIVTPKRIILTGTPIQNNLKEYYSMVNFIKPLFLGTEKEFANLYANPIRNGQHKDSSKRDIKVMKQRSFVLHKKLSKFVQRKEAELLKSFLPQKYEYVLFIPMTEVQNNLYEYILEFISKREDNRGRSLITDYTCLRKIWTHPKVLEDAWKNATAIKFKKDTRRHVLHSDEDEPDDIYDSRTGVMSVTHDWWRHLITINDLETILPSKKIRTMFEILRMCEENGEKCLIFSAFVAVLNVVEYFLKKINEREPRTLSELNITHSLNKNRNTWIVGTDYYRLDGKTPKSIRHEMIKNFNSTQNNRARVFLISARAGGQGINLIGANRVIILDTSWNPSNDQQNIFRIFRLGQKKNCYIYRLLAMGTMEEKVYSRSVTKQAMSFRVVDEQQIDRHYSMAELAELYTLTKPNYGVRPMPIFPQDNILANLLLNFPDLVYKYHEHDSLLENKVEQELSEQDKADAWASYERDLQFNSEIRDLPAIDGLSNNFSPHQIQNYFNSLQGSNVNSMFNWNMGHQISSTSLLQTMSQYNYPNASQQYLEMLNILRKMSPSVMVYPELNKSITEDAFNAYNLQKSAATSAAPSHSSSSAVLSGLPTTTNPHSHSANSIAYSGLPTTTNPLSALGDLSLYGINPLKSQQRSNNAYCTPTFTNSSLSSQSYVTNPNSIMTALEQYKPMSALDNATLSGRSQITKQLPSSSSNLTSIAIPSPSQKSPVTCEEQVNRKVTQIPTEALSKLSNVLPNEEKKKQEGQNKPVGSTTRNILNPHVNTVNNPTKPTSHWNPSYTQSKTGKLHSMTLSTNDSSRASNVGIMYPSTKSVSNTITPIQLSSTNMGIVYPNKEKSQSLRSDEMRIMPSSNTSDTSGNTKQINEISPSISLTAVRGNINSKTGSNTSVEKNVNNYQKHNYVNFTKKEQNVPQQSLNTKKQQTNFSSTASAPIKTKGYSGNITPAGSNSTSNILPFSISNDIDCSKTNHLSSGNPFQSPQAQCAVKAKPLKIQTSTLIASTTKPSTGKNLSETRNKPVTPITSAVELKKRVEINSSNLSAVKHALNIRQVENKKNPTGTGLFIIEASVNEKKVAIGTPTKSGGGTTITKVSVTDKRKIVDNISKDDPVPNAKRPKITNARHYDF